MRISNARICLALPSRPAVVRRPPRACAQAYSWRSDRTSVILWHQIDAQGQVFAAVWGLDTAGTGP